MELIKQELWLRLNNPQTVRMYANMIRTSDMNVVRDLYDNLSTYCSEHSKYNDLLPLFKERLGEQL